MEPATPSNCSLVPEMLTVTACPIEPVEMELSAEEPGAVNGVVTSDFQPGIIDQSNMTRVPVKENHGKRNRTNSGDGTPNANEAPANSKRSRTTTDTSKDKEKQRKDVQQDPFTIYRIDVPKALSYLQTQAKLIEQETVNEEEMLNDEGTLTEEITTNEETLTEEIAIITHIMSGQGFTKVPENPYHKETFDFHVVIYTKTTNKVDALSEYLGLTEMNVTVNKILFYHRPSEIFALCTTQTWHKVQEHCCELFPDQISNRMASLNGSFQDKYLKLTGNAQSSTTTWRTASYLNDISAVENTRQTEFRKNASIYRLNEFARREKNFKVTFGFGSVRIERSIMVKNIPEIFHHFSLICNGGATRTDDDKDEVDVERPVPMLRKVPKHVSKQQNDQLEKMIYDFVIGGHPRVTTMFDTSYNYKQKLESGAKEYLLKYGTGGDRGNVVQEFKHYPNCFQVLSALCSSQLFTKNGTGLISLEEFRGTKKKVFLSCYVGRKNEGIALVKLLEGGFNDTWNIKGKWYRAHDNFHLRLHNQFLQLLKPSDILLTMDDEGYLFKPWNRLITADYVALYRNEANYFVPGAIDKCGYDLMRFVERENDKCVIYLYYIFDGINGTFMEASKRVAESLRESEKDNGNNRLSELISKSRKRDVSCEINVVMTFLPSHPLDGPRAPGEVESLMERWTREKNLLTNFTEENVRNEIVAKLKSSSKEWIQTQQNFEDETSEKVIMEKLLENGYCTITSESKSELGDRRVSGKLLKIRWHEDFKLFDDNPEVNKEVYYLIEEKWLSRFGSVMHKMECAQVQYDVLNCKGKDLKLKFTEIPGID